MCHQHLSVANYRHFPIPGSYPRNMNSAFPLLTLRKAPPPVVSSLVATLDSQDSSVTLCHCVTWLCEMCRMLSIPLTPPPPAPHEKELGLVSQGLSREFVRDTSLGSHGWNKISAFGGSLPSCSSCLDILHFPALFAVLSQRPMENLIRRESQRIKWPHLHILLQVCCLFA